MKTRRDLVPPEWFETLYGTEPDPWHFATSDYERQKYAATLAALSRSTYGRGLEIGCSIGIFTRQLAPRVGKLLAVDVVPNAIEAARRECRDQPSVEFSLTRVPDELPAGRFDLITLSEVGYYWDHTRLEDFAAWLATALAPGGECVLVHWTGETDYPLTADEVHDGIIRATSGFLRVRRSTAEETYRLDVLEAPLREL